VYGLILKKTFFPISCKLRKQDTFTWVSNISTRKQQWW